MTNESFAAARMAGGGLGVQGHAARIFRGRSPKLLQVVTLSE